MNRLERRKRKNKFVVNTIIIIILFVIIIWIKFEEYKEKIIDRNANLYSTKNLRLETNDAEKSDSKKNTVQEEKYPKEQIESKYKGFNVIAKLEIPKINLETLVIEKFSEKALSVSVTKFWGANPNEIGNFCIAGHNFKNKNMFCNLKELEIGDCFWVKDNNIGVVEYQIYDIYKVLPNDVGCLEQQTFGRREVTLITCTIDSKKRIIIKAKEVLEL